MKIITICIAALAMFASISRGDENYPQIMIRAEFITVPKVVLDNVGRGAPEQLPSARLILGFKQSGQATVLHSPTLLMQTGQESTVKSVQEIIYPTDLSVTTQSVTTPAHRPVHWTPPLFRAARPLLAQYPGRSFHASLLCYRDSGR
jgi:hypothetical protein